MLRYLADLRSLTYLFISSALFIIHWNLPEFNIYIYLATLFMSTTTFVVVHNHKHVPMWKSDILNKITDFYLITLYGFPVFVWVPTHNQNHHKYVNTNEDYTKTYRYTNKNNVLTLLSYPFISAYFQNKPTTDYLTKIYKTNKPHFIYCISQYVFLLFFWGILLYLSPFKMLVYVLVPQFFCLFSVLCVNYVQHIHTNENVPYKNSRNFVGIENWFLLNNGLHTAHHLKMSYHWSTLNTLHNEIKDKIPSKLIEKSLAWYLIRTYIVSLFIPRLRSKQIQ